MSQSLNSRFDKNLEALFKVNPLLAAQLQILEPNKKYEVYIGQDLISAQSGKDWEIQIDNFLNKIKNIRLKTSKKNITQGIFRDELTKIIKDCKEDSRVPSLTKEIKSYNYDGTPLYTPKDEKGLLDYIEVYLLNISKDIEKDENNFKQMYPRYLEKMKEF